MRVKDLIISEINQKGKIDISEFINLSQYGDSGYYIKQNPIGLNNDFITAPEVSQMFGEIVGLFILFHQSMCLIARMRFKTEEERKKFWEYYG